MLKQMQQKNEMRQLPREKLSLDAHPLANIQLQMIMADLIFLNEFKIENLWPQLTFAPLNFSYEPPLNEIREQIYISQNQNSLFSQPDLLHPAIAEYLRRIQDEPLINPNVFNRRSDTFSTARKPSAVSKTNVEKLEEWKYQNEVPAELRCPISHQIFTYPVTLNVYGSSGQTYDKEVLLEWIDTQQTCPVTRLPINKHWIDDNLGFYGSKCIHNIAIQEAVDEFMLKVETETQQQIITKI